MKPSGNIFDFFAFEKESNVAQVKFKGYTIWAYLRNFYGEKFVLKSERANRPSVGLAGRGIKNFFYGFRNWFRSYEQIVFIYANQRKLIDGQWVHPLEQMPAEFLANSLFIELPDKEGHISQSKIKHKYVASRFFLIAFEFLLLKLMPNRRYADVEVKMSVVEKDLGLSIRPSYLVRRFDCARLVMRVLIKLYRPKRMICTVGYTMMGYIVACHENGVPVTELQHGYIGEAHRAYNVPAGLDRIFYPDSLLCWGAYEKKYFAKGENQFIDPDNVVIVGNFNLEEIAKTAGNFQLSPANSGRFKTIVAISMQDPLEKEIIEAICQAAVLDETKGYLILPRNKSPSAYQQEYTLPNNVFFEAERSTYQGIMLADVHVTVFSTTAIEALVLGKPNVLLNINNLSRQFLGNVLSKTDCTLYAEDSTDLNRLVERAQGFSPENIVTVSQRFMAKGYARNLRAFLTSEV